MNRSVLIVAVIAVAAVALSVASSALLLQPSTAGGPASSSSPTPQTTIIQSVGVQVYSDPQATALCTQIQWGVIDEGDNATRVVYVKNTGSSNASLHMYTVNWEPSVAGELMSLFWDREGDVVLPGEVVLAVLTLTTSWDMGDVEFFDFDLVVEGSD